MKTASIGQAIIRIDPYMIITTSTNMLEKKILNYSEKVISSREPLSVDVRYKLHTQKIRKNANIDQSTKESINIEGQTYNVIPLPCYNYTYTWGILIDNKGDVFKNGLYSYDYQMIYYPDYLSIAPEKFNVSLKKIKEVDADADIKAKPKIGTIEKKEAPYEIIYSGKNNISLNFTYREYTPEEMARTAFFQNITYQADAKSIRFRNFEIKIHSASNEKITYTILADGLK